MTITNPKKILLIFFLLFQSLPSFADFSGNAKFTTDYIWRGVSQTQGRGAAQAELTYSILDSGFYVTIFGSNVQFEDDPARAEFTYSVGYSKDINDDWNIDLGINQYTYLESFDDNYKELYATIKYKILSLEMGYTDDVFATGTNGYYAAFGTKFELSKNVKNEIFKQIFLNAHVGYFMKNADVDGGSYADYLISVIKEIGKTGVNIELGWTDTSGRKADDGQDTSRVFLSITKEF